MSSKKILKAAGKVARVKGSAGRIINKWQIVGRGKAALSMLLVLLMVTMLLSDAVVGIYSALAFEEQSESVETVESAPAPAEDNKSTNPDTNGGGV